MVLTVLETHIIGYLIVVVHTIWYLVVVNPYLIVLDGGGP